MEYSPARGQYSASMACILILYAVYLLQYPQTFLRLLLLQFP